MVVRGLDSLCTSIKQQVELRASDRSHKADDDQNDDAGDQEGQKEAIPFVIDAMAFLHHPFNAHFGDSVFGGEYASFKRFVIDSIAAWRAVDLHPTFVFDGSPSPGKIPIIVKDLSDKAAKLSHYMNSDPDARLSIPWQTSISFVPPLLHCALFEAVRRTSGDVVLSPGEARPVVVTLAGKLGGYAVSNDSDFFVLNPPGATYKGYVPLDSILYVCQDGPEPAEETRRTGLGASSIPDDPPPVIQSYPPLYPTDPYSAVSSLHVTSIKFASYLPSKLAACFELPPALLLVIGPLLANDTSSPAYSRVPDPAMTANSEHMASVSDADQRPLLYLHALQEEWKVRTAGDTGGTSSTLPSTDATSITDSTISDLTPIVPGATDMRALVGSVRRRMVLSESTSPTGGAGSEIPSSSGGTRQDGDQTARIFGDEGTPEEEEEIIDTVMKQWQSNAALMRLEPADVDNPDLSRFIAHLLPPVDSEKASAEQKASVTNLNDAKSADGAEANLDEQQRERLAILRRYARNFHALDFSYSLPQILFERIYVSPFMLEEPDQTSVAADAAQHIRRWVYAIVFGAYGSEWARETI
ncbi:hypothetical protein V8E36_004956, partial [Tilletia maclaganii]